LGAFEQGEPGELVRGEGGEESLDVAEPPPDVVEGLLLAGGEGELGVEGGAGAARQGVAAVLVLGEPGGRGGAVAGELSDDVALVQGVLGVLGEEQPDVGGDVGVGLVLLAGEASGGVAAVVEGEPGARQLGVEAGDFTALRLEPLLGRVVRLGGRLRLPVQPLKLRQQLGDGPLSWLGHAHRG